MKFLLNNAILASLVIGIAKGKDASTIEMEDFAYWRELVDAVDSLPATASPKASPTVTPVEPTAAPVTDAPVSPETDAPVSSEAPVSPCQTIGMCLVTTKR